MISHVTRKNSSSSSNGNSSNNGSTHLHMSSPGSRIHGLGRAALAPVRVKKPDDLQVPGARGAVHGCRSGAQRRYGPCEPLDDAEVAVVRRGVDCCRRSPLRAVLVKVDEYLRGG